MADYSEVLRRNAAKGPKRKKRSGEPQTLWNSPTSAASSEIAEEKAEEKQQSPKRKAPAYKAPSPKDPFSKAPSGKDSANKAPADKAPSQQASEEHVSSPIRGNRVGSKSRTSSGSLASDSTPAGRPRTSGDLDRRAAAVATNRRSGASSAASQVDNGASASSGVDSSETESWNIDTKAARTAPKFEIPTGEPKPIGNNYQYKQQSPSDKDPVAKEPEHKAPSVQDPIREAPYAKAPNSQAPVAKAPIKQAPTTEDPSGQAPNTEDPSGQAPIHKAPDQQAPIAEAPISQAPNCEAPNSQEPNVWDPTGEDPSYAAPSHEALMHQAPFTNASTYETPIKQAPVGKAPTSEAPVHQDPGEEQVTQARFATYEISDDTSHGDMPKREALTNQTIGNTTLPQKLTNQELVPGNTQAKNYEAWIDTDSISLGVAKHQPEVLLSREPAEPTQPNTGELVSNTASRNPAARLPQPHSKNVASDFVTASVPLTEPNRLTAKPRSKPITVGKLKDLPPVEQGIDLGKDERFLRKYWLDSDHPRLPRSQERFLFFYFFLYRRAAELNCARVLCTNQMAADYFGKKAKATLTNYRAVGESFGLFKTHTVTNFEKKDGEEAGTYFFLQSPWSDESQT